MENPGIARKIVSLSAASAALWLCIQITLAIGVEKKSIFQLFADIFGGGSAGMAIGFVFFLIFGAVGFVSGAIHGALGLFWLMFGGALGGLGIGSLIHIARNPSHYNFNTPVIVVCIFVTYFLVKWALSATGNLYDKHGPLLAQWFLAKFDK